jgi:zinc transport system ATP-binding protein
MDSSTGPVVRVNGVTFGYDRQVVLDAVSLDIGPRDYLAIIGPNGGGKTTLVKLVLGLLTPWSGTVSLAVSGPHAAGYVPQFASFDKNFPLRVEEVVAMGRLGLAGVGRGYSATDHSAVDAVLERFGLRHLASTCVAELSGGQLQRTLIARALAGEPEILFLDEPLASIDSESREVVLGTLADLNEAIPIVVVSHDVTLFGGAVKQIACVNRQLHYHASGELTNEMLEEVYGCPVELVAHGVPHRVMEDH